MRILIRPRFPVFALLLLAPTIPELLTGSTSIAWLVTDPARFLLGFPLDIALYGCGALLIREFAAAYRKGWASILLLGAAYGIAEEGFATHTFFAPPSQTVGALGVYGHLFGVNWLWALALTVFHATYSIALPILLTNLWFPQVKEVRWFDRGTVALLALVYAAEVVGFGLVVPYGPSPGALAFFVAVAGALTALATWSPRYLLAVPPGPRKVGRNGLVLLGTVEFAVYVLILFFSSTWLIPALGAGAVLVLANGAVLFLILRWVRGDDLERSEFYFAVGMLSALFAWDVLLEFILVPGILAVSAVFVYLLVRLSRTLNARSATPKVPLGAAGTPPTGT